MDRGLGAAGKLPDSDVDLLLGIIFTAADKLPSDHYRESFFILSYKANLIQKDLRLRVRHN